MLQKYIGFDNSVTVSGWQAARRSIAVAACVAVLAGCDSMPTYSEMKTGIGNTYDKTVSSIDRAWNSKSDAAAEETVKEDKVVSLNRWAVKRLQTRLTKLGYRPGPADGVMGLQTTKAIKSYQSANSLPPNGRITERFLKHVEENYAAATGQQMPASTRY